MLLTPDMCTRYTGGFVFSSSVFTPNLWLDKSFFTCLRTEAVFTKRERNQVAIMRASHSVGSIKETISSLRICDEEKGEVHLYDRPRSNGITIYDLYESPLFLDEDRLIQFAQVTNIDLRESMKGRAKSVYVYNPYNNAPYIDEPITTLMAVNSQQPLYRPTNWPQYTSCKARGVFSFCNVYEYVHIDRMRTTESMKIGESAIYGPRMTDECLLMIDCGVQYKSTGQSEQVHISHARISAMFDFLSLPIRIVDVCEGVCLIDTSSAPVSIYANRLRLLAKE